MAEQKNGETPSTDTSSDYYWNSYAHFGIHEEMLKDSVRTGTYMRAILRNTHLFKDKVVLDVGCGTGILSLFAAKAGAKKVYAVDCSSIINQATTIIADNGFADTITTVRGKIEEVEIPEKVDVIISEWMGYFLLYESMLNSVLVARDRFLKEDGIILPDKATMYIGLIEDGEYKSDKLDFWENVYGFDMSCIRDIAYTEPLVDIVEQNALVSDVAVLYTIDINTVTIEELTFQSEFELTAVHQDYAHGFVAWFDCDFSACHNNIAFSTGPEAKYTHWKQTVFYLKDNLMLTVGDKIKGKLTCAPNANNPRDLDITIKVDFDGEPAVHETYAYQLK